MSTTLGVMLLSFSFVTANFSALKSCCAPESTLFKIRDTNGTENFKCANTISDQNDDIVDQTERVLGFGIVEQEQPQFPQCTRTTYLNISRSGEESMSLPTNSCILGLSDRLIVMKCENNNNSEQFQNIGFINKCCPHGYSYITELNKCSLRDPDFSVFINIFDKPMIFVDNSFGCAKNQVLIEYEITANDIRWKNNQLVWKDGTKSFKRNEFCLETIIANSNVEQSHQFLIRSCQKNAICRSLACIRKCCGDGEFYAKGNRTTLCKRENNEHNFQSSSTLNISGNFTKPSEFGVLSGLDCPKFRLDPDSYSDESHIISSTNGSLFIASTNKVYSNGQYCIEKIKNSSFVDQKLYTFLCFDSKVVGNDRIRFQMYPIGLLISCCFYAITLLVYISLEKLRNLPGKILICLVSSLLMAYLGIALGQLMPTSNNDMCFISGFFVYFCLMAAFAWMNITCFDIWKTFGSTRSKNFQRSAQKSQFVCYSIYGWGLPTLLTTITASLTKSNLLAESIRPNFGHGRCWFTYDTIGFASLLFFSGPVGLLYIINLVLFLLTLKYCNHVKKEIFRMQSSNVEKPALKHRFFMDKTRFVMNTKLCFVMGITWLLEIASILFYDHKKNFFWSISDSFNVLLGVFVFFIFVFKRRVWKEIMLRLGIRTEKKDRRSENMTRVTHSTYAGQSISMKRLDKIDSDTLLNR